jgi:uncharacterized protein YjiS (DUF1127 family)
MYQSNIDIATIISQIGFMTLSALEAAVERTLTYPLLKALITDRTGIALLDVGRRLIAAIADELRISRDVRQLAAMDDHRLKDIGMRRSEIEHCVRYGRGE